MFGDGGAGWGLRARGQSEGKWNEANPCRPFVGITMKQMKRHLDASGK
jgi:hypothetical protein